MVNIIVVLLILSIPVWLSLMLYGSEIEQLFHLISWQSSNVFAHLPVKRFNKSQSGSIKYKCGDFSILEMLYKLLFNKCLHLVI